ncbi:MAG: hypothetical protein ACI9LE_000737 [Paraglaciecola sp.]|jgi:hypothetical protein
MSSDLSEKMSTLSGDGKSKETAFYFKKARTSQEAMKLSYQYLKEVGYEVNLEDKQNGGVEDGHAFHIWITHLGTIWFKIPFFEGF